MDDDTGRLLADSAARILEDLCTPALLRAQGDERASGLAALSEALEQAGLAAALAPESAGGAGLGWPEVGPMLGVLGRYGVPLPLADTMGAQALARMAGVALPQGPVGLAAAGFSPGGDRVRAPSVAHADQVLWVAWRVAGSSIAGEDRSRMQWAVADAVIDAELPGGASALLAGAAVRAAQIGGAGQRVMEIASRYVNEREQFGRPIGKFQAIQQQLAVGAEWAAMASMAAQLAMAGPGVQLPAGRVAAAKQVAGTAADTCANVAHAVHGAIGVTAEYDLQLYTRRLWSWAADFGSSLYWATQLGETVLASGDALIWDEVVKLSVA